ncbi:MAG: hypothetical protein JST20_11760 [Bacteroidetes bacterium]|nr:hypothetical protein [Bacteroidota bacterium]
MKDTLFALLFFVFLLGCSDNATSPSSPQINIGTEVKLVQQNIATSGGTIVVNRPGDSINGLTINIPPNSYGETKKFKVSFAPITNHNFGPLFHPITPVIKISNGGGYSDSIMSLKIPIQVPKNQFAMAFMYDATTGELEGLPISELESDYITVATRHFTHTSLSSLGKGLLIAEEDASFTQLIVSSVDTNELMKDHFTPFKPGVDDWQFINWGSYISPDGNCAGQATGMLWYYSQKKLKGSPALFGRFDNDGIRKTPDIWQDDVLGYRFCSMLQLEQRITISNALIEKWQGKDDIRTLRAFSYSLRLTNSPQFVGIDNLTKKVGHAMVVYGISRGTLFIADPNYPGRLEQRIRFDEINRIYQPYFTGLKAGDPGTQFPIIHYLAKTGIQNWNTASEHWKNVANGTIGKGTFPDYTIVALNENDNFIPLENDFKVPLGGRLTINIRGKGFIGDFQVFNKYQDNIPRDGSSVQLQPGKNLIGIVIMDTAKNWIDFKWINVIVPGEEINGPASGYLNLNLWVDGEKANVDSATFSVTGSSQIYYFLDINATIANKNDKYYKNYMRVAVGQWNGGKYDGPLSLFTGFTQNNAGSFYSFNLFNPDFGNATITDWSYKKLNGTFNFKGYTEDKSKTVSVYGNFSFLK